jgi:molecular chaperone GrpE
MRGNQAGTTGIPKHFETDMSDDTMAQDGFEPRPEMEKPAPDGTAGAPTPDPVEALQAENTDLRDRVLRLAAEMENLRKRMEREIADTRAYAITKFARDMLTATDSLSRAMLVLPPEARDTADGPMKSLIEGIELTEREMQRLLAVHGVKPIEAEGQKFDPHRHQAMFEVPDPTRPEGTVVQVVQTGYAIGDRVLRPAMVGVAKGGGAAGAPPAGEAHIDKNV